MRVVDYFPKNLEDFSVPCKISEYDVLSDCGSSNIDSEVEANRMQWDEGRGWSGEMRWEWRFYLLVEDSEVMKTVPSKGSVPRLKILITEQDAVMLLKMDAEKYIAINLIVEAADLEQSSRKAGGIGFPQGEALHPLGRPRRTQSSRNFRAQVSRFK